MALTATQRIVAKAWLRDRFSVRDYDGIIDMIAATGAQQLAALKAFALEKLPEYQQKLAEAEAVTAEAAATEDALEAINQ